MKPLIALLALMLAGLSTTPSEITATAQSFALYLPAVEGAHTPLKGAASCGPVTLSWCYNYFPPDSINDAAPNEVVPLVSGRLMQIAGNPPLRVGASRYALLLNEPDITNPETSDGLTPAQGAAKLKAYSDELLPQGAKLICCGTMGTAWMDAMLASYQAQYHVDALSLLTGFSYHDYAVVGAPCSTDACYVANWQAHAQAWRGWIAGKAGAYPTRQYETWISESGWSPCCEPDAATAVRHLQLLCAAMATAGVTRIAWYTGSPQAGNIALTDASGLTALGTQWGTCGR